MMVNPKPAACITAQILPSADFGHRCCGNPSGCPHTSVRFAHPSDGFGSLAQQGVRKDAASRRLPPGGRRLLGKRCKSRQKSRHRQFLTSQSNPEQFLLLLRVVVFSVTGFSGEHPRRFRQPQGLGFAFSENSTASVISSASPVAGRPLASWNCFTRSAQVSL